MMDKTWDISAKVWSRLRNETSHMASVAPLVPAYDNFQACHRFSKGDRMSLPVTESELLRQKPLDLFQIGDLATQLSSIMNMSTSSNIFRSDFRAKSIHTLGPQFTSSHLAAIELMRRTKCNFAIELHDSFENILQLESDGEINSALALVPSAYAQANHFFMSEKTVLIGCVCIDTPPYHLSWRKGLQNPFLHEGGEVSIATHSAPANLIRRLLVEDIKYKLVYYNSTVLSAMAAIRGETDAALCNLNTIKAYGMGYHPDGIPINMTWNLFLVKLT